MQWRRHVVDHSQKSRRRMEELCKIRMKPSPERSSSAVPRKERSYLVHHPISYHHDFSKWTTDHQAPVRSQKEARIIETRNHLRQTNTKKEQAKHIFELPTIRELVLSPNVNPGSWGMGVNHEQVQ
jgi:hypothetical protein